jgi:hypothetical protein
VGKLENILPKVAFRGYGSVALNTDFGCLFKLQKEGRVEEVVLSVNVLFLAPLFLVPLLVSALSDPCSGYASNLQARSQVWKRAHRREKA